MLGFSERSPSTGASVAGARAPTPVTKARTKAPTTS